MATTIDLASPIASTSTFVFPEASTTTVSPPDELPPARVGKVRNPRKVRGKKRRPLATTKTTSPSSPPSTPPSSTTGPPEDVLDESVKRCEAIDRSGDPCKDVVVGGLKGKVSKNWCAVHEKEEKILRDDFARCAFSLHTKPKTKPPNSAPIALALDVSFLLPDAQINAATSVEQLEKWELHARAKLSVAQKALSVREYHLKHFARNGAVRGIGEDGELAKLVKRIARVVEEGNKMLAHITKRAHYLILEIEDALWLLKQAENQEAASTAPVCSPSSSPSPLRPPCTPTLQTASEEPDPVTAIEKMKRGELLELLSLTGSHASFIKDTRKSVERVRIVECLFRRLISRDRTLFVRAHRAGVDHVLRFFEDPVHCPLVDLQRLHTALLNTTIHQIKEAITDAFRAIAWEESGATETEDGEAGLGLQLLGGWLYMHPLKAEMGAREWGHLYDLCGCPGCALRVCTTFNEFAKTRRLTVVTHGTKPPPYLLWGEPDESDAARIFRALDIVDCSESTGVGKTEIKNAKGGLVGAKGRAVYVERTERNWIFLKLSLTHPKVSAILTALASNYVLIIRPILPRSATKTPVFPVPPSSQLWLARQRTAPSKAELKLHSWAADSPGMFGSKQPEDALRALDSLASPESEQGVPKFTDVYEALVLDAFGRAGEGTGKVVGEYVLRTYEQFEAEVGQTVLAAMGLASYKKAIEWGEAESYRRGDLEWTFADKDKNAHGNGKSVGGKVGAVASSNSNSSAVVSGNAAAAAAGGKKDAEGKAKAMLDSLRDDELAFKLSRSLFR